MDSLFLFVFEVMFERVDDMKEIVEHPMSPAGSESSIFALCSPLSEADFHISIRELLGIWSILTRRVGLLAFVLIRHSLY